MEKVSWGIIGCGAVAEQKSGPAFQKSVNSSLLAVMRRNSDKAKDFARRHGVALWYDNADDLLNNSEISAVYIATPPVSHLELTLKAIKAGKNIYLEKPMALNKEEANIILEALKNSPVKLTLAHYRRKLPVFRKVFELLNKQVIGDVRFVDIRILQSQKSQNGNSLEENWRVNPKVSGGGYFHDLAPHHLDLMLHFFGDFDQAQGFSDNQSHNYKAKDIVNGIATFTNGVHLRGIWNFNVSEMHEKDQCIIYGSKGSIEFSFFGNKVIVKGVNSNATFSFEQIPHVQQPMVEATVKYFLGEERINPCSAEEGLKTLEIVDIFSR
ncbi:Gfo/Idh/MocA family protein [Gramella sp. KN1008]|uniref:Gfo/Idh/MocA family protein n=1 Tax=Gramella sp. KN1008 TaxID=2529298 RepID=UPI00103914C0|nr:Gfo/Idh/MocA family oxidoreductase [Gramella sp. KN1008]TBW28639.1 Gfo/Idh/MocA family oxidoreductase [Gramella sp. KN1008]